MTNIKNTLLPNESLIMLFAEVYVWFEVHECDHIYAPIKTLIKIE